MIKRLRKMIHFVNILHVEEEACTKKNQYFLPEKTLNILYEIKRIL